MPSLEAAIERARRQNRTVKITESDINVAENEIGVAESPFYPRLNLELGATAGRDINVAENEIGVAESPFYPRLNLEFGATAGRDIDGATGADNDATALVVMRWNLYRGGSDIAQRRVALGRMSQAMAQRHVATRNAEEETRRSWVQLRTATDRVPVLASAVQLNRRVRNAYNDQFFNQGQRSLIDVLNAENELFIASGRLVSAEQARIFAAYRLLAATGDLVDVLALEMPPAADERKRTPVPNDPRPTRTR
jgi:adhesin transport system outer membrane protein